MELLQMMKERRSIRKYLPTRIEKEKLEKIVEAGLYIKTKIGLPCIIVI